MKKGITLTVLAATVVIMFILIGVSSAIGISSIKTAAYEEFMSKVKRVSDYVNEYYLENEELPIGTEIVSKEGLEDSLKAEINRNNDNNNNLYVVDMSRINTESVNIGKGTVSDLDVFLVAENTHNVYYLKGILYKGEAYHGVYVPPLLPKQYQQVESIETNSYNTGAYINTGVQFDNDVGFYIDFQLISTDFSTTYGGAIIGTVFTNKILWLINDKICLQNSTQININIDTARHTATLNYLNSGTDSVDNNTKTTANISNTNEISIFAFNSYPLTAGSHCKIFSVKISEGTNIVRDLIPCYRKSDNEVGMYDIVNGVFYTNSGSGDFVAGPEV